MKGDIVYGPPPVIRGRIEVERLGGFAGYGMPGARVRSRGQVTFEALDRTDQFKVYRLLMNPALASPRAGDAFRYRLTGRSSAGLHTVEVAEADAPDIIRDCVRDELLPD